MPDEIVKTISNVKEKTFTKLKILVTEQAIISFYLSWGGDFIKIKIQKNFIDFVSMNSL